ncbi:MAG TPA: S8 family serine peptidase [Vicinamibacterales bacterium]
MFLNEYTGRGVRIAVVDSGVHAGHPHVGGVEQGVGIRDDGSLDEDFVDRLGHGTAVTAAIREKSPDAAIIAVKVFWRALSTDVGSLVRGIDEGRVRGASIINLSLGTSNVAHRTLLQEAVQRASAHHVLIVGAIESDIEWLPGSLDGVIPVMLDWRCPRDEYRIVTHNGRLAVAASGYPREIPNVPPERNLKGISFAVANASGFIARARQASHGDQSSDIWKTLESGAHVG